MRKRILFAAFILFTFFCVTAKGQFVTSGFTVSNIDQAKTMADICKSGVIDDISDCNEAFGILEGYNQRLLEKKRYEQFYTSHKLAAKYHLRWCKSAMLPKDYDIECRVVDKVLRNYQDKILNEEKLSLFRAFFIRNTLEAAVVVKGECSNILSDPWYFLDVNIQTEKCNAAIQTLGAVM